MILSLTNTVPHFKNLPHTAKLSSLLPPCPPSHLLESRTLELEGIVEVI